MVVLTLIHVDVRVIVATNRDLEQEIVNGNLNYIKENNKIYECVEVIRIEIDKKTKKEIKKEKLYDEKVLIKYELPSDVKVEEM